MAQRLPSRATVGETLAVAVNVVLPTLGKGVLIRRKRIVSIADRMELDQRAVQQLMALRARHGDRPLQLSLPGRPRVIILSPADAMTVLDHTPEPYMAASSEKQAALAHFEPEVALASRGGARQQRREFNEDVLASNEVVHPCAQAVATIVEDEIGPLLLPEGGALDWPTFSEAWFRIVRRIVLGNGARDDVELTRQLARLRKRANWAFLAPRNQRLLKRFHARLAAHLERAEPGSLASRVAEYASEGDAPTDQAAHWLFAYDPAGMAVFRALALLCADREAYERAQQDRGGSEMPFLRACMMESLRLWPTTPAILRETDQDVDLNGCRLQKGTGVVILAPLFHRDEATMKHANRFAPELWPLGQTANDDAVVPFSAGPARCPARHLVLMTGAMALGALVEQQWRQTSGTRFGSEEMPATLDPYSLAFEPH